MATLGDSHLLAVEVHLFEFQQKFAVVLDHGLTYRASLIQLSHTYVHFNLVKHAYLAGSTLFDKYASLVKWRVVNRRIDGGE